MTREKAARTRRYVVLLRAVSNVPMAPFRAAMEELGFTGVASFGMSGNLSYYAPPGDVRDMEHWIGERFGTTALVRTRSELARIAESAPFWDAGAVLFLAARPRRARVAALEKVAFTPPRPVLRGRTLYFVYPASLEGERSPFDLRPSWESAAQPGR